MTSTSAARTDREPTAREILRPFWFFGALLMMLDVEGFACSSGSAAASRAPSGARPQRVSMGPSGAAVSTRGEPTM